MKFCVFIVLVLTSMAARSTVQDTVNYWDVFLDESKVLNVNEYEKDVVIHISKSDLTKNLEFIINYHPCSPFLGTDHHLIVQDQKGSIVAMDKIKNMGESFTLKTEELLDRYNKTGNSIFHLKQLVKHNSNTYENNMFSIIIDDPDQWLYRVSLYDDIADAGYVNSKGDTIVPVGRYDICLDDTLKFFATVWDPERKAFIAIDNHGDFMYKIFFFDNGPDYLVEGLFRIEIGDLIGYANKYGEVVIPPKYQAAWPFKNGKAKVAYKATKETHDEHWSWQADEWFYIDRQGNRIKE